MKGLLALAMLVLGACSPHLNNKQHLHSKRTIVIVVEVSRWIGPDLWPEIDQAVLDAVATVPSGSRAMVIAVGGSAGEILYRQVRAVGDERPTGEPVMAEVQAELRNKLGLVRGGVVARGSAIEEAFALVSERFYYGKEKWLVFIGDGLTNKGVSPRPFSAADVYGLKNAQVFLAFLTSEFTRQLSEESRREIRAAFVASLVKADVRASDITLGHPSELHAWMRQIGEGK